MNKQKLISRYAKKFANTSKDKDEVTRGARYLKDGTVIVTNRHYLLRIRDAHTLESAITLDPKSGLPIEGTYPDAEKVFPKSQKNAILLPSDLSDLLLRVGCACDVATRIDKKHPIVKLVSSNGVVHSVVDTEDQPTIYYEALFGNLEKVEHMPSISLNADYLYTALRVFNDAGTTVRVKFYGSNEPVVLSNDRDIDVLILPYRTAEGLS